MLKTSDRKTFLQDYPQNRIIDFQNKDDKASFI